MKAFKKVLAFVLSAMLVLSAASVGGMALISFAADAGQTTVTATDGNKLTVAYKETRSYYFDAQNVPEGASIHVYQDDEDRGEVVSPAYICVQEPTEDFTVEARVLDADGEVIASSGKVEVTVRNGFFDRLADSIKRSFSGSFFDAIGDIFSAIYVRIRQFLNI